MRTTPRGVRRVTATRPGPAGSSSSSQATSTSSRGWCDRLAQPGGDALRRPGDVQLGDAHVAAAGRRMVLAVGLPVDEERQLRVGHRVQDADLLPVQVVPVGPNAVTLHGLPAEPGLHLRHVRDRHDPAHPAAALVGPRAHRAAEGCAVGRGVVERGDDLEVGPASQREDEVAGAEARVQTAVGEGRTEGGPDPLDRVGEVLDGGGVRDMIEAHAPIEHRAESGRGRTPRIGVIRPLTQALPRWDKHTQWGTAARPGTHDQKGGPADAPASASIGWAHRTPPSAGEEPMGNAKLVHELRRDRTGRARSHRRRVRLGHRDAAQGDRPRRLRPGLRQHRVVPVGDHLHRRRRRDPALSRVPDRAAGRALHLHRGQLPADLRRAARRPTSSRPSRRASSRTRCCTRTCAGSSTGSRATRTRCRC